MEELYSKLELDSAQTLLNIISPSDRVIIADESLVYEGQIFSPDNLPVVGTDSQFLNCEFINMVLSGKKANSLVCIDSVFNKCSITNSNFKYANFKGTVFTMNADATSFDYTDFTNTELYKSSFTGCSFNGSVFLATKITGCIFIHTEFTDVVFEGVEFNGIDFTKVSFENAKFKNCVFSECILPYFEILHISYGLNEILTNENILFRPVNTSHEVNCIEYIHEIYALLPAFYNEHDYLSVCNIFLYEGNVSNTVSTIISGLKYACQKRNFRLINCLCSFAGSNSFFSKNQLKQFMDILENNICMENLSIVEKQKYLNMLTDAKKILIDMRTAPNEMCITLETNFDYKEPLKMEYVLQKVNFIIEEISKNTTHNIIIRHNSSPVFTINLFGEWENLLLIFGVMTFIFKNTSSFILKIQEIAKNHQDIKLKQLERRLKEIQLKKESQKKSTTISPEDYLRLSYVMLCSSSTPQVPLRFDTEDKTLFCK